MSSSEASSSEDESGGRSSEKGHDPKGKKRRPSKGERRKRRKEEAEAATTHPEPPSKVAKLREVVHHNKNLQGRGARRGFGGERGGKGMSAILLESPVGQIGTPPAHTSRLRPHAGELHS